MEAVVTLGDIVALLARRGLVAGTANLSAQTLGARVTGMDCDSRVAAPGHIFVCKGAAFSPAYLATAVRVGAIAYLADTAHAPALATRAPNLAALAVTDVRAAMSAAARTAWGRPDEALTTIGVTGTKGKSTTTCMLRAILDGERPGSAAALMGSIDTYDGVERFESVNTTPEAPDLWRHFANAAATRLPYMVMEVSSHALKYGRVEGLTFDVAAFLNIGRDHISAAEHPTFADYFASKLRIFAQSHTAVVNMDMSRAAVVDAAARDACERVVRVSAAGVHTAAVGVSPAADVYATEVTHELGQVSFVAHTPSWEGRVVLPMPGTFNVENALVAIAVSEALGIGRELVVPGLAKTRVPGRMELLETPDPRVVGLVDYAHNKLSYQRFFASVAEEFAGRRIIAVFGAPGGKAQERRAELPAEAARWADVLIYTEEDPAGERVEDICAEMAANTPAGVAHEVIPDRAEAIERAVELAFSAPEPAGAVVCLLAKGDETRQHRGNSFVPVRPDGHLFAHAVARRLTAG